MPSTLNRKTVSSNLTAPTIAFGRTELGQATYDVLMSRMSAKEVVRRQCSREFVLAMRRKYRMFRPPRVKMSTDSSVRKVAKILEDHFRTLPKNKERKARRDLHALALKVEKRAKKMSSSDSSSSSKNGGLAKR